MLNKLHQNVFYPVITTALGTVIFMAAGYLLSALDLIVFIIIPFLIIGYLLLLGNLKVKDLPRFLFQGFLFCLVFGILWLAGTLIGVESVMSLAGAYIHEASRIIFMVVLLTGGGTFLSLFLYGQTSWKFFTPIYFVMGILFGILNASMPQGSDIIFAIGITGIGTSIGLALGLYESHDHPIKVVIIMIAVSVIGGLGIFAFTSLSPSNQSVPSSELSNPELVLEFEDPVFEDAIRSYYKLGSGAIQWKDIGYRTTLDLRYQKIDGQISSMVDLKWFVNIQDLMWNSNQGGNLSAFQEFGDLVNLTELHLDDTEITGDINYLQYLPNLERFSMDNTNVYGDIGDLAVITKLIDFSLEDSQVTGDIGGLANLPNLTEFHLDNTAVSGDIGSLKSVGMEVFTLVNTQVSGDICDMAVSMVNLEAFNLEGTDVYGNISCLASLEELNHINLNDTAVTGDQGSLAELDNLEETSFDNTEVIGELNLQ